MRVLVCGGRDYNNTPQLTKTLDKLHKDIQIDVIIEGDARGADRMSGYWARKNKIDNIKFRAQWDKYGPKAGSLRNQQMLDEGKPDLVVAFPGGTGTADMIRRVRKANIEVIEIGTA